ncbi:MAG: dihydroneopterin aldolase, partial [Chloroflexi bacterium]|nr:dihydroneopterin aldolase [Chloroflexota bacterium]
VYLDLSRAGVSDSLSDTVNYSALHQAAKSVLEGPAYRLLEAVAEALSQRVLTSFPVTAVRVRVIKPSPPIRDASVGSAAVEIYRMNPKEPAQT